MPMHRHKKKWTRILSDVGPLGPPGPSAGPNTAEAVQRPGVRTGQELPTGLAAPNVLLNPPGTVEGAGCILNPT